MILVKASEEPPFPAPCEQQTGFPVGTRAIAARANVTAESLIDQAEALLTGAADAKQYSAAVSALKEKGVLSGKRVERSEVGAPGEFDHLSDDELMAAIEERYARLKDDLRLDAEVDEEMRGLGSAPGGERQH